MKKFLLIIVLCFTLLPVSVFADCKKDGATIIYINGIFTTEREARKDSDKLEYLYIEKYGEGIKFLTGYNATHLGGLGDLIKSVEQAYGAKGLDTDLISILNNMHQELSTRKVLLVGHSQGTFYTNLTYDYLVNHGVPRESIGIYNIATPADHVAGGGNYVTSDTDKAINSVVRDLTIKGSAYHPLPANISIPLPLQEDKDQFGGHSLSNVYLAIASDRILEEIHDSIDALKSSSDASECFWLPKVGISDKLSKVGLKLGDGVVNLLATGKSIVSRTIASLRLSKEIFVAGGAPVTIGQLAASRRFSMGDYSITSALPKMPVTLPAKYDAKQDEIDDFLESLDSARAAARAVSTDAPTQTPTEVPKPTPVTLTTTTTKSGSHAIYPKILISEVQIAGATDSKEEFVELYNPNNSMVDLTNWYLQRKTKEADSFTTFAPNNLFTNQKILPHGFFLIARQGYFAGLADMLMDNALTEDNTLALKSPSGQVMDKVGWGAAPDFENSPAQNPEAGVSQSIGRSDQELDTQDNFTDFLFNTPTPRGVNALYTPPPPPKPLKNILINEIQTDSIAGTGGTSDDWVELYNPNDVDVSLKGWAIQKHSKDSPCSLTKSFYHKNFVSTAVIKAHGFFLIVSASAKDDLKSSAGMTAAWSLSDDNTIYLVKPDETFSDSVGFGPSACFAETAPAPFIPEGKSMERKKLGQDTDDNRQDFKISDEITPGATFPRVTIVDATNYAYNVSQVPNPPSAPFYNMLIRWQSANTKIDFYQVQYALLDGAWQDWQVKTTETQSYFQIPYSLLSDQKYRFRVRAQDKDGVMGDWSEEMTIHLQNPIIINEVAYAGTNASGADQWIELYNKSDRDIDLTGYRLVSGDGFGQNAKDTIHLSLKGRILAKGYFVLERNDDHVLENVTADQLFFSPIGVNYIYLRAPNNRYVDEFYVPQHGLSEGSFIKNGRRASMERVSAISFGLADKNWQVNNEVVINGTDRNDEPVAGTPGAVNSVNGLYTYYNTSFIENATLKKEFSPYLFAGQNTMVAKGVTLTIEPGTTLKFYDRQSKLEVRGTFNAIGLPDAPIVFTSFLDDEFGGDSNRNAHVTSANPGDWLSLYFSSESQNSQLENVRVRFAGAVLGSSPLGWGNAVWADGTTITIKNSVIENNRNRALVLTNSNSIIDTVKFSHNNTTDWPFEGQSMGVWIEGGAPEIRNSNFENNYYGIFISGWFDKKAKSIVLAKPKIENNTFVKNVYPAMFDVYSAPDFSGNVAHENSADVIVLPNEIVGDLALKPDLPYLAKNIVLVRENATLALNPGVTVLFNDNRSGLQINGKLLALGLSDAPISFKPLNFTDANIQPGAFLGLRFTKTSSGSELENVSVMYGGSRQDNAYLCGIRVEETAISLKNSVISKNAGCGLGLINSLSVVDAVEFSDNTSSNLTSEARALWVQGNAPIIKNSIFKNNYYGIYQEDFKNEATGEVTGFSPVLENNQFENNIIDIFPLATP